MPQRLPSTAAKRASSSTYLSHVRHFERLQFLVVLQDRHILSWHETMLLQVMSGLRLGPDYIIVLEAPSRSTRAAAPMHETANAIRLACPEPPYITAMALLMPCSGIEMSVRGERRDERIAMTDAAYRIIGAACEIQRDQSETGIRQRVPGLSSRRSVAHSCRRRWPTGWLEISSIHHDSSPKRPARIGAVGPAALEADQCLSGAFLPACATRLDHVCSPPRYRAGDDRSS